MMTCTRCGSYAINHHSHGRDGSDGDLCDVCYWRKRAERVPLTDEQIDQIHSDNCEAYERGDVEYESRGLARAIERAHGITAEGT